MVHNTFRHYDQIVKNNKFASFAVDMPEIKKNGGIISQIKKNRKKQTIVLKLNKESVNSLKKLKKSKKIKKAVKKLAKAFKKQTKLDLRYVMLPYGAPEKVVDAFNNKKIAVVSKASKISKVKSADVSAFNGVVLVESSKCKKGDFSKLKKSMKKSSVAAVSMRECIPTGSAARKAAATDSEAETTDAEVEKSAAMKSQTDAEETDAENTTANSSATTTPEVKAKENSASSIVVSSVLSVAAIATVAAFLL